MQLTDPAALLAIASAVLVAFLLLRALLGGGKKATDSGEHAAKVLQGGGKGSMGACPF